MSLCPYIYQHKDIRKKSKKKMTFLEKKLYLFESQWLNGVNDGLLRIYDWLRFVAVAGFVTV
jgi:hypothetical protein